MKHVLLIMSVGLVAVCCKAEEPEVLCDGTILVAEKGEYILEQACPQLCEGCFGQRADASVCVGGDAGVPHCPCLDDTIATLCWVEGEVGILCDGSTCP